MWYDARSMRMLFYVGVMVFCIGLGLRLMDYGMITALPLCIGVVCIVIGFSGLLLNMAVKRNISKRK
jgi:hypothetical protein